MKIRSVPVLLVLVTCICPITLGQKCKEKLPNLGPFTNAGAPKIKQKPEPQYTEEARRHQITGTVLLRGTFHSSGKVQDVCWVSGLPYGLTENAIKAAYKIVFEPITRDGKAVSKRIFIYYNFNLY
jgi:TonB family protein